MYKGRELGPKEWRHTPAKGHRTLPYWTRGDNAKVIATEDGYFKAVTPAGALVMQADEQRAERFLSASDARAHLDKQA